MKNFTQLKKNLKKDYSNLKITKIAVLGDTSTQFLAQALKGLGYDFGYNPDIFEADFNQIEIQVFDPSSDLYKFEPEFVIIFRSSHKLLGKYNKLTAEQQSTLATDELNSIQHIYTTIISNLNVKIILYNYNEIDDSVFGNFANKIESSFLFQTRKLNYELMLLAQKSLNLFLCDLSSIQNQVGKSSFFQTAVYINTEMVLSIEVLPIVASITFDIINSLNGSFHKCIILDLDNTIWGGIIGDDGIENIEIGSLGIGKAFSEFQYWIKKLRSRGIIVAICSKNTESVAKLPFEKHPDMVLQLDDISVFMANWNNKVDNIRQIQKTLNIGFESMVFLDDNPFERNMVRENISQICVPELPDDPAEYLEYLYTLNLFETTSFSNEDTERTKMYQNESKRLDVQNQFTNEDDFLKSLNMHSLIESFNTFNSPRIAQLSQRSNQFNLRTIRYTESEILNLGTSKEHFTFAFSLKDKFGDHGLICVVILRKEKNGFLFIDTWLMSCRVLKRGMESFVLNTIINFARDNGFTILKGEYIETPKNEMVKDHYIKLGFKNEQPYWLLDINNYDPKANYIQTTI